MKNADKIVQMKVSDLVPYRKNPRKNDASVDFVANSIKEFGFQVPIVVDKDNVIVAGHTRYEASKKLGLKEVPCIVADGLTEEQIKAYRLADNKVSEFSKWDNSLLDGELFDIKDIDMSSFGFDVSDFDDESDAEEEPEIPFTEELGEENNYVVLFFDNTVDWLQAQTVLGIKSVKAFNGLSKNKSSKIGVGRVMNGTEFINRMMQ